MLKAERDQKKHQHCFKCLNFFLEIVNVSSYRQNVASSGHAWQRQRKVLQDDWHKGVRNEVQLLEKQQMFLDKSEERN